MCLVLLRMSAHPPARAQGMDSSKPEDKTSKAYLCPLCHHFLQAPVRLACTHAFCWGCITMYCLGLVQSSHDSSVDNGAASPAQMSQLQQGWAPLGEAGGVSQFSCPVCKQKQRLDLDNLNVDQNLARFVDKHSLQRGHSNADVSMTSSTSDVLTTPRSVKSDGSELDSSATEAPMTAQITDASSSAPEPPALTSKESNTSGVGPAQEPLLPPQQPRWYGKLSIVLDIDGTLIASFPPRRSPRLPASMRTHLVGAGSSLNPQGARWPSSLV